jgi:hypothetical protein
MVHTHHGDRGWAPFPRYIMWTLLFFQKNSWKLLQHQLNCVFFIYKKSISKHTHNSSSWFNIPLRNHSFFKANNTIQWSLIRILRAGSSHPPRLFKHSSEFFPWDFSYFRWDHTSLLLSSKKKKKKTIFLSRGLYSRSSTMVF